MEFILGLAQTYRWMCKNCAFFNPKRPGGGLRQPIGHKIACHFSQDQAMFTKILDFVHMHPNQKLVKSFFYYLDRFSRNLAETAKKLQFFEIEKRGMVFFPFFSKQKSVILFQISMKIVLSFLLRYITFLQLKN